MNESALQIFPCSIHELVFEMKSYASYFVLVLDLLFAFDSLLSQVFQKIHLPLHLHLQSIKLVKSQNITLTDQLIITIIMLKLQELKSVKTA